MAAGTLCGVLLLAVSQSWEFGSKSGSHQYAMWPGVPEIRCVVISKVHFAMLDVPSLGWWLSVKPLQDCSILALAKLLGRSSSLGPCCGCGGCSGGGSALLCPQSGWLALVDGACIPLQTTVACPLSGRQGLLAVIAPNSVVKFGDIKGCFAAIDLPGTSGTCEEDMLRQS